MCIFAHENRYRMEEKKHPPSTWDEAMSDLDSSESDILNGHGTSWATVKQMISERIREYAR